MIDEIENPAEMPQEGPQSLNLGDECEQEPQSEIMQPGQNARVIEANNTLIELRDGLVEVRISVSPLFTEPKKALSMALYLYDKVKKNGKKKESLDYAG